MLAALRPMRRVLGAVARPRRPGTGSRRGRGRAALGWAVAAFVGLHVAFNLYLEARHPEVYDPEYRDRLTVLRDRARDAPDLPLLFVVGSSRVMTNFRPEDLPPMPTPDGSWALPVNLSRTGSGPLMNLVQVRRARRDSFAPRWVVVEVLPALLGDPPHVRGVTAADLPVLANHVSPAKLCGAYLSERAGAMTARRSAFLRHYWNDVRITGGPWDAQPLLPLGGLAVAPHADAGPDEVRRRTAVTVGQYAARLKRLRVHPSSDGAMRELLALCAEKRIGVVLVLTPESSEFRGAYPPAAVRLVDDYCRGLGREYGVPVVDARDWLPDDCFGDGHHATARGAGEFTRRLGREVLQPLIDGRLRNNITP